MIVILSIISSWRFPEISWYRFWAISPIPSAWTQRRAYKRATWTDKRLCPFQTQQAKYVSALLLHTGRMTPMTHRLLFVAIVLLLTIIPHKGTHSHPSKSVSLLRSHCSGIEGQWWPGLIVSEPRLLSSTESLLIYISSSPPPPTSRHRWQKSDAHADSSPKDWLISFDPDTSRRETLLPLFRSTVAHFKEALRRVN